MGPGRDCWSMVMRTTKYDLWEVIFLPCDILAVAGFKVCRTFSTEETIDADKNEKVFTEMV